MNIWSGLFFFYNFLSSYESETIFHGDEEISDSKLVQTVKGKEGTAKKNSTVVEQTVREKSEEESVKHFIC